MVTTRLAPQREGTPGLLSPVVMVLQASIKEGAHSWPDFLGSADLVSWDWPILSCPPACKKPWSSLISTYHQGAPCILDLQPLLVGDPGKG